MEYSDFLPPLELLLLYTQQKMLCLKDLFLMKSRLLDTVLPHIKLFLMINVQLKASNFPSSNSQPICLKTKIFVIQNGM